MAYWFTSSRTARAAASLTDSGAGKSGNPWARFTPPCCWHRRVISRITDSVNRVLRSETRGRMGLSYYRPAGARPKRRLSGAPRPFGAAGQPPLPLLGARRGLARPRRLFIATDEEGGHVSQLAGHLVVPPNALLLGRGAEPGVIEWVSRVTAERLRALGIDWVFAPVADVHSRALNPVIGPRAFSTAP